jgi:ATP-dependent exoDNAse (exonuclease V) beta subunit
MSNYLPLKIYKASAGSGKTFTLVKEYLRMLLESGDVYRFKRIIAMTFTNKAALEMKERVIKVLNQLVRQADDDMGLVRNYSESFNISPEALSEKAQKALSAILHNYSELNIQTIDKFNVRLIRSFVRDLNISSDFEVLVDTDEFNEKVVDKFLDSIHSRDRDQIKNRMVIDFLEAKLERGEAWNIRQELIDTLKLFEKETFRVLLPKLLEYDFNFNNLRQLKQSLEDIEALYEKEKKSILIPFLMRYDYNSFKLEFNVKGWNFLYKRFEKQTENSLLDFEVFTDGMQRSINTYLEQTNTSNFHVDFMKVLDFADRVINQYKDAYLSYSAALSSYYQLALLKYLIEQVEQQKKIENIIPINEVNDLISSQMRQENADFIYERVGVRFDHFLLDEFQDTSRMQWLNLIPLVHNAIAQNQLNLIVGDSKQAIYRFRNGVVEQFATLPLIYNPDKEPELLRISDYFERNAESKTLIQNRRSRYDIVDFNNKLFQHLRLHLAPEYQQYYEDKSLIQEPFNPARGYVTVEVEVLENSNEGEFIDEEEQDEYIGPDEEFMLERVWDALRRNFLKRDICILSRNNKELGRWAKLLIKKGIDVSTDEGLAVSNSVSVRFIVAWMQLILKPGSEQFQRDFVLNYMLLNKDADQDRFLKYFMRSQFDLNSFLEDHFSGFAVYQIHYENLYDLVLKMLRKMEIDELADPFLHFFCNMVQQFDLKFGPNIERFLHYYHTRGKDNRVPLAEGDAVRLMTAHKSKGLEFKVVIMPKASWDWKKQSKHLYYDGQRSLFYMSGISNKDRSTKLQRALLEQEREKNKLDTFNLFYVACTRAVDELHIRAAYNKTKESEKQNVGASIGHYLDQYLSKNYSDLKTSHEGKTTYSFGEPVRLDEQSFKTENLNLSLHGEMLWFPEIALIDRDSLDAMHLEGECVFGRLVHEVLAHMQSPNDLEAAMQQLLRKQVVQDETLSRIRTHIELLCAEKGLTDLIFPQPTKGEKSLDEREIVLSPVERIRPDRVILQGNKIRVIEYKTGLERQRDARQLKHYVLALQEMGYESCEAYLIYTDDMRIKRIA